MDTAANHFLYQNLASKLLSAPDDNCQCIKCGNTKHVTRKANTKGEDLCLVCQFLCLSHPMSSKPGQTLRIGGKDTLMLITENRAEVYADNVLPDGGNIRVDPTPIRWRKRLGDYILDEHGEHGPAMVILAGRGWTAHNYRISHSPDFLYLCGEKSLRINVRQVRNAYAVVADVPINKWSRYLHLRKVQRCGVIQEKNLKILQKLSRDYPDLKQNEALLPLSGAPEFEALQWCCGAKEAAL